MSCEILGEVCKLSGRGEKLPIQIDLTDFCERRWDKDRAAGIYTLGETVRPSKTLRTGFEYECTATGQVGVEEPQWPLIPGEVVIDGSVAWTCRVISNLSLRKTISTAVWDPAGFTKSDEVITSTNGRQLVSCFLAGDQAKKKYLVEVKVTFSDTHAEDFGVIVKVE